MFICAFIANYNALPSTTPADTAKVFKTTHLYYWHQLYINTPWLIRFVRIKKRFNFSSKNHFIETKNKNVWKKLFLKFLVTSTRWDWIFALTISFKWPILYFSQIQSLNTVPMGHSSESSMFDNLSEAASGATILISQV